MHGAIEIGFIIITYLLPVMKSNILTLGSSSTAFRDGASVIL